MTLALNCGSGCLLNACRFMPVADGRLLAFYCFEPAEPAPGLGIGGGCAWPHRNEQLKQLSQPAVDSVSSAG